MRFQKTWLLVAGVAVLLAYGAEAQQQRRLRVRPRVQQHQVESSAELESIEDQDNRAQQAIQYYRAQAREDEDPRQLVLVASDDDYNGQYGTPAPRARADTYRPPVKVTTAAPLAARQKVQEARAPPVQTIRNYNKVNDDGSFTFGYEAADGSFKEETRGTDCVVRGKYGYIDPDGNKREFTYVSGNPCDPNNPEGSEEEQDKSEEDANENVPQNYPKRPVAPRPAVPRPVPTRPAQTTPRPTTTVFQNTYTSNYDDEESEEEVQIGQRPRPVARPFSNQPQTVTQRPRVQVINTTPNSFSRTPTQTSPVNITPKPVYRLASPNTIQSQPPPTTYRPDTTTPLSNFFSTTKADALLGGTRQPLDFDAEFKKFQHENKIPSTTPAKPSSSSTQKQVTKNPVYQTQLVFDPQTGQYDTGYYQQLPQSEGDFQLNHRIQPFVQNPAAHQQSQLVSLEQLQQQSPLYRQQQPQPAPAQVQIPQQIYQKQQNELQFVNSQQLFAQQVELQQNQLRNDRLEAAKKVNSGLRYQTAAPQHLRLQPQPQQQYYFIPPQGQSGGQIDAFLRGHNIEY
ncbi:PAX-interacting protein 1-like [Toxorhynchites rutilus septentrionalis]|uniref:PAX-interacting protein 1-like n=1 Tax=Toxorhynchites rutilus septentrionalis TaxID=329112 RepID=UPI00247A96E1|nr:PAX-interacting protein 1-like [Toxorhynchites rutilus septentrionalis]XP_055616629.1 PAX-interacting protein 1-like [Toxorhynchites rutilus septentrionalis]